MIEITLDAVRNQQFTVRLANQNVNIKLSQSLFTHDMYIDVALDKTPILQGVLCLNAVKIIRMEYFGFKGDLVFLDTKGINNPDYRELGERYKLYYIEA